MIPHPELSKRRLQRLEAILKKRRTMCVLCLFLSLDEVDLVICNSKYRNKVSRGESRTAVSYWVPLAPAPVTCVCPSVETIGLGTRVCWFMSKGLSHNN